ncbi:MFS transporter [Brucella sp. H1_1004]|uniref:MFS transporter n=1 Tax=Brucella sp. H1_1004 TaxID=3110109 RepID=UPI0039B391D3
MRKSTDPKHTKRHRGWASICVLGLTTFTVVTTEMLPVGLLTSIARTLEISVGNAGLIISVPAFLAAFFAPFVIIMGGDIDRRHILAGLLILLTAANIASAIAPSFYLLLAARVAVGFCIGGIWAVAGGLAPRLVPTQSIGTATAIIFGGVAAASVMGVPVGALIGDAAGWRWAFGVMAGFSAIVLGLSLFVLPALPISQTIGISQIIGALKCLPVQLGLILTLLLVAGHFMAYTFIGPVLQAISKVLPEWIASLLFLYGVAGIAGNFLAGTFAVQRLATTLCAIIIGLLIAILGFAVLGGTPASGVGILVLWGLTYGGVSVTLQTWMMKVAPSAIEIATALFVSVFNIAIATGSFIGGQIVDRTDLHTNLLVAATLPALALLLILITSRRY